MFASLDATSAAIGQCYNNITHSASDRVSLSLARIANLSTRMPISVCLEDARLGCGRKVIRLESGVKR